MITNYEEDTMKKRNYGFFIIALLACILVGCGNGEANTEKKVEKEEVTIDETEEKVTETSGSATSEEQEATEQTEETEADVFEASTESTEKSETSENLFDKQKVFKFNNGDIVMTLEKAVFTKQYGASNAAPEDIESYIADNETYLVITGKIKNDTTNSVSFGNALGQINFSLTYDEKHTFTNVSSAEEEDGTKLGASSIDALSEGNIHVRFQLPKTVAESDKPLVLTVINGDDKFDLNLK